MLHSVAPVPLTHDKDMHQDRVQAVGGSKFKIICIISNGYILTTAVNVIPLEIMQIILNLLPPTA